MSTKSHCSGSNRDLVDMLKETLSKYPVTYKFETGGRHPRAIVTLPDGSERKITFSSSTKSRNAMWGVRGDVRRIMRQAGLEEVA